MYNRTRLAVQYDVLTATQHATTADLIAGGLATRDLTTHWQLWNTHRLYIFCFIVCYVLLLH